MPELDIDRDLERAAKVAMKNEFVKYARVLDTKEGQVSPISMMRLLEIFDETTLIIGLRAIKNQINEDFCTLDTIIKVIKETEQSNQHLYEQVGN